MLVSCRGSTGAFSQELKAVIELDTTAEGGRGGGSHTGCCEFHAPPFIFASKYTVIFTLADMKIKCLLSCSLYVSNISQNVYFSFMIVLISLP